MTRTQTSSIEEHRAAHQTVLDFEKYHLIARESILRRVQRSVRHVPERLEVNLSGEELRQGKEVCEHEEWNGEIRGEEHGESKDERGIGLGVVDANGRGHGKEH